MRRNYYGHTPDQEELAETFDDLRVVMARLEEVNARKADDLRAYVRDLLLDEIEYARKTLRRERQRVRRRLPG